MAVQGNPKSLILAPKSLILAPIEKAYRLSDFLLVTNSNIGPIRRKTPWILSNFWTNLMSLRVDSLSYSWCKFRDSSLRHLTQYCQYQRVTDGRRDN